jgi:hypothetical protein
VGLLLAAPALAQQIEPVPQQVGTRAAALEVEPNTAPTAVGAAVPGEVALAETEALRAALEETLRELEELREVAASGVLLTTLEEQAERIDDLESTLFDLDERVGSRGLLRAFDGMSMDVGGFLTQSFTATPDQDSTQASFNQTLFELLLRTQISDDWSLFTAFGLLREADLSFADPNNPAFRSFANRVPQIIVWANYRHSDPLQMQIGRFVTPHGIINIEHFPPVLYEINQPQFLRPFSGATIFPNFMDGAQLHGRMFVGSGNDSLEYNAYAGVFVGDDPSAILSGGRLGYRMNSIGLAVGANYGHGRRDSAPGPTPLGNFSIVGGRSLTNNTYDTVGVDVLLDNSKVIWKSEFFHSFEHDVDDRVAFYSQPGWRINERLMTFYRFDYFDPGQGLPSGTEHVVGLNVLATSTVRIRGAYFLKQFTDPYAETPVFQLSTTISF